MISFCIPIYNYCVLPLVQSLHGQLAQMGDDAGEIVCIDDHSDEAFVEQNKDVAGMAVLVRLDANVGRARIRNLFLQHTRGEYMVFLDCDSVVPEHFVQAYSDLLAGHPSVVVGGRVYDKRGDDIDHRLRYIYGTQVESQPAEVRRRFPYRSFMTNNFMIRRDVLDAIRFDESIVRYGHEDTLFGYRLEQAAVPIVHIDNAVVNGEVEDNREFLRKTVEGVENLAEIYSRMGDDEGFCQSVRLLRTYERLCGMHLTGVVFFLFRALRSPLESHFEAGNGISVTQFNFYKLGVFIKKMQSIKQHP